MSASPQGVISGWALREIKGTSGMAKRSALITGAGTGIGRAIALRLAAEGIRVFLAARDRNRLETVADEIRGRQQSAEVVPTNITREAEVAALFHKIAESAAQLDVCVNNAGIGIYNPLIEITSEDLDRMYETNVRGTFLCCREAMRMMVPAGSGYIINISSVLGFKGYERQSGYTATKHAVMGLTKSLAAEAQSHGIRVSAILPGGVDTEMVRQSRPDLDPLELLDPDDVAHAVMYLLSLSDQAAVDQIYIRRRSSKPF